MGRRADVLFPQDRVAVFVDGCFWHGCPEHHRASTKNPEFWTDKVQRNRLRDAGHQPAFDERGLDGHPRMGTRGSCHSGRQDRGGTSRTAPK
ncbi:very short patch repair endonuclease [Streptacidiphilus sp. PB12-B1b]|uniref:very short patch repair endonuclease n=1 Tax=Streptacidiphilus sp. PB12-B1b TaxID=2705012 RepID=UPI001CDD36B9|nr:very short patch repair endonuclease [Streptacidiphilus sp. PB12-B1b]